MGEADGLSGFIGDQGVGLGPADVNAEEIPITLLLALLSGFL